jgi:hypothetical protein
LVGTLVPEDGAVDADLSAVIDELSPNKEGVSVSGSERDRLPRPDELRTLAAIPIPITGVVPFI